MIDGLWEDFYTPEAAEYFNKSSIASPEEGVCMKQEIFQVINTAIENNYLDVPGELKELYKFYNEFGFVMDLPMCKQFISLVESYYKQFLMNERKNKIETDF